MCKPGEPCGPKVHSLSEPQPAGTQNKPAAESLGLAIAMSGLSGDLNIMWLQRKGAATTVPVLGMVVRSKGHAGFIPVAEALHPAQLSDLYESPPVGKMEVVEYGRDDDLETLILDRLRQRDAELAANQAAGVAGDLGSSEELAK